MTIKKVVFLGGALLVLAACSDAVAPTSARSVDHSAALKDSTNSRTTFTTTFTSTAVTTSLDGCRSGFPISSGRSDSTCVDQDQ